MCVRTPQAASLSGFFFCGTYGIYLNLYLGKRQLFYIFVYKIFTT